MIENKSLHFSTLRKILPCVFKHLACNSLNLNVEKSTLMPKLCHYALNVHVYPFLIAIPAPAVQAGMVSPRYQLPSSISPDPYRWRPHALAAFAIGENTDFSSGETSGFKSRKSSPDLMTTAISSRDICQSLQGSVSATPGHVRPWCSPVQ